MRLVALACAASIALATGGAHAAPIDEGSAETWDCAAYLDDPAKLAACRAALPGNAFTRCLDYERTRRALADAFTICARYDTAEEG